MPLEKLTRQQLVGTNHRTSSTSQEYARFIRNLKPGEGGRTTTIAEGVSRQTIKARLKKAAQESGISIKFHRCPPDEVKFEVLGGE